MSVPIQSVLVTLKRYRENFSKLWISAENQQKKNNGFTSMKILCVIPGRAGSKGVRHKNTRMINGEPLIAFAIKAAKRSTYIDRLIVSSEDDEILSIAKDLKIDIPFKRPKELAADTSPLISVVQHAYNFFKEQKQYFDAVVCLQPTCPFVKTETIDSAVDLWQRTGCDSVTTVSEITKGHPYISKRMENNHMIKNFCIIPENAVVSPRQKREKAYYLTGSLYLRDKRLLQNIETKGHCLGVDSKAVVVDEFEAVDINTEFDLKFAEYIMSSRA